MSLTEPSDLGDLPAEVVALIDCRRHVRTASFAAEAGHGTASCASVRNGNPLFWDEAVAGRLTGGSVLPPTTLSNWSRPHPWDPADAAGPTPLPTHFDLKERLGLPDAVISAAELAFHEPVRPGDVMTMGETLRSVSGPKQTSLGRGRFWTIDVDYLNDRDDLVGIETLTGFGYRSAGDAVPSPRPIVASAPVTREAPTAATTTTATRHRLQLDEASVGDRLPDLVHELTVTDVVLGAMAARDWRPMHHDPAFARERSGVADVFLDTPTQQAWCERFLTDWTGPTGRLGRLDLSMGRPVVAGDTMTVSAEVDDLAVDATGSAWVTVVGSIAVDGAIRTRVRARLAVPAAPGDNPWARRGSDWLP